VRWKVDNQDGDDTAYVLAVRRDGDADWRALSLGKPPFTSTSFEWNTETFADGWYRLRVSSSDAIANSPDRALEAARTSALFVVDNTPPTIAGLAVKGGKAEAEIADALSVVTELAFSIDDEPWRLATTVDGIFDDLRPSGLRLAVPSLAKGTHTLVGPRGGRGGQRGGRDGDLRRPVAGPRPRAGRSAPRGRVAPPPRPWSRRSSPTASSG
jgi:hypothetical protein